MLIRTREKLTEVVKGIQRDLGRAPPVPLLRFCVWDLGWFGSRQFRRRQELANATLDRPICRA